MRSVLPLLIVPLVLLGGVLAAPAGEEADAARTAEIEKLVRQLGDEDYATREAASRRLLEIGEPARAALERTVKESDDMEARWRAEQVLLRLGGAAERAVAPGAPGAPGPEPRPEPRPLPEEAAREDLEAWLERVQKAWRRMEERLGPPAGFEQQKVFRAEGLELEVDVFGLLMQVRLEVEGGAGAPDVPTTYVGRTLDQILRRNPDLQAHPGMAALKTQWDAYKRENPNLFVFEPFLDDDPAGPGGTRLRVTLDGFGQGTEIHQLGDRVVVKLHDTDENGKQTTRTLEGANLDEIREKHPDVAHRIPVDLGDFETARTRFWRRFGPRGALPPAGGPATAPPGVAVPTPRFGVELREVDPVLSSQLRLRPGEGVIVAEVQPGSQAAEIGLERYDIVLTVDGRAVRTLDHATDLLGAAARDRTPLRLGIIRRGEAAVLER